MMFSAEGLLPMKTTMHVWHDGRPELTRITGRVFWRDGSSSPIELPADIARFQVYLILDPRDLRRLSKLALHRHQLRYPPDFAGPLESDDVYVLPAGGPYSRSPYEGWRVVGVMVEDGSPWLDRWRTER